MHETIVTVAFGVQTPEHIPQTCPTYSNLTRVQIWPEGEGGSERRAVGAHTQAWGRQQTLSGQQGCRYSLTNQCSKTDEEVVRLCRGW